MTYWLIPVLFLLALIEASVLPLFRVAGLQPDLVLVTLVVMLMLRGWQETFLLIPFAAVFIGLVDAAPVGTALLALAPLVLLHELRGAHLREGGFIMSMLFVVVATIAYHLVYLGVLAATGQSGSWAMAMTHIVIPTCLLNAVVLPPIYVAIAVLSAAQRRPLYA
jgi:hypothetical protein